MSKQTVVGTKKQGKLRRFGYIHVSTSMQVDGEYSLDVQQNRVERHAKDNDMILVEFSATRASLVRI